jgi:hypothetical protein
MRLWAKAANAIFTWSAHIALNRGLFCRIWASKTTQMIILCLSMLKIVNIGIMQAFLLQARLFSSKQYSTAQAGAKLKIVLIYTIFLLM